jgi:hypothetical protein
MIEYIYYVCNEFGDTLYEFKDEGSAMESCNYQNGESVSRKQLLTEEEPYAKNAQQL